MGKWGERDLGGVGGDAEGYCGTVQPEMDTRRESFRQSGQKLMKSKGVQIISDR